MAKCVAMKPKGKLVEIFQRRKACRIDSIAVERLHLDPCLLLSAGLWQAALDACIAAHRRTLCVVRGHASDQSLFYSSLAFRDIDGQPEARVLWLPSRQYSN